MFRTTNDGRGMGGRSQEHKSCQIDFWRESGHRTGDGQENKVINFWGVVSGVKRGVGVVTDGQWRE